MKYCEGRAARQQAEIETIKDRQIALQLSDADCERLASMAGMHGLSVSELLQSFIGDLVDGTYSNGSDERGLAQDWFDRCGFSHMYEETLLRHLLDNGCDIGQFLIAYDELQYFKTNADASEEMEPDEKLWFEEEYEDIIDDFLKEHSDSNLENEISICRKWHTDLQKLKS